MVKWRAALTIATVVLVGILVGATTSASAVASGRASPQRIIATRGSRVVVLSAADGHVIRTLVDAGGDVVTGIGLTPDARTLYYAVGAQCTEKSELWRVSMRTGARKRVAKLGAAPLVSPDGRTLAYATSSVGRLYGCSTTDTLVLRDLASGKEVSRQVAPSNGFAAPVAWWPDSKRLVVTKGLDMVIVRIRSNGLHEERELQIYGNGFELLTEDEALSAYPTTTTSQIAVFEPSTGRRGRLVAEITQPLFLIDADPSGTNFLFSGPLADSPNGHDLLRARVGDETPVKLTEHITSALWLVER